MKNLLPGSRCIIYVSTSHEEIAKTVGTFEGFVPVGEESSLCVVLDESHGELAGKTRLIPTNMIVAIDVLEEGEEEEIEETYEENHYYG